MKKLTTITLLLSLCTCMIASAQVNMTSADLSTIKTALGSKYDAQVISGNFVITDPATMANIKVSTTGGLTNFGPGSVSTVIAVYKDVYYIYKAGDVLSSNLGAVRAKQIQAVLQKYGMFLFSPSGTICK